MRHKRLYEKAHACTKPSSFVPKCDLTNISDAERAAGQTQCSWNCAAWQGKAGRA